MNFLFPLLYLLLFTGTLVVIFKKNFSKCLPLSFMITALIVFLSQVIFKSFLPGIIINIIGSLYFAFYIIKSIVQKDNLDNIKNCYLTKTFYIFIIMYIGIFIFDLFREFSTWDEFSHWGVMIKEMFRLDKFYSVSESTLMVHKDYPPILQCFEYFYAYISGGYSEYSIIKALHLFEFSLLLPLFKDNELNKFKSILRTIIMVICSYLIILLFDHHNVINTIYTDYFMALLVIYIMGVILINKTYTDKFNLVNLSISLTVLLLTKQMGLPLYLMCVFFFINCIFYNNVKTSKPIVKIITTLLVLIIPLVFYSGWNNYVNKLDIDKQFDFQKIDYKVNSTKIKTYNNFMDASVHKDISTSYVSITYFTSLLIFFISLVLITFFCRKYISTPRLVKLNLTLVLGYVGYGVVMLFLYVFLFGNVEGPMLSSYDRYMATFVIISFILLLVVTNHILNNSKERTKWIVTLIIFMILIVLQSPSSYKKLIPALKKDDKSIYEKYADKLNSSNITGKVYIVANESEGQFEYRIKYYSDKITTNAHQEWGSYTDVNSYLTGYDYVYFVQINDTFIKEHNNIFKNLKNGSLYKINNYEYEEL